MFRQAGTRAIRPGRMSTRTEFDEMSPQEREERIELYARRAADHLPLFEEQFQVAPESAAD